MPRWCLGIEYDGSCFAGFQRQRHGAGATVQGDLEQALTRIADAPVRLVCAGRTDAGVHATAQVVHFDTEAARPVRAWVRGGNTLTRPGLCIHWAREVPEDFHARFSARWRRYLYLMSDLAPKQALLRDRVAAVRGPLDADAMDRAAAALLGEQDFSTFRAAGCQARHAVREVQAVRVRRGGDLIAVEIRANAFLQHMVRNIAGSLILIGRGERDPAWLGAVLAARDRRLAGPAAPPEGLYLTGVGFDPVWRLPQSTPRIWPPDPDAWSDEGGAIEGPAAGGF